MNRRSTIKDVAALAGVSPAAVSLVLNERGDSVPLSTKERIRAAARALHYTPNYSARAMVTKRTHIVGVIVPDIANGFFADLVRSIQLELADFGYDVILCNSGESAENDERYIRLLAGRGADGLILTLSAEAFRPERLIGITQRLAESNIPYLFLDRCPDKACGVSVDNLGSSRRMAEYLLDCGHRNLGVITGPLSHGGSADRLEGVRLALLERGMALAENRIFQGGYDMETGCAGAGALIERGVSAIFAFSDIQACGVYGYLRGAGKRVPGDLSVAGFDDALCSRILETPLTTMRQPVEGLARAACRRLRNMMSGGKEEGRETLPAQLVRRGSVRNIV